MRIMRKLELVAILFLIVSSCSGHEDRVEAVDNKIEVEKKEFPLIMYAVLSSDAAFSKVKAMGFNFVHQYGLASGDYDASKKEKITNYLNLANKYGLKVMFDLDGTYRMRKEGDQVFADFKQVVKDFKNHPALGMWYLFDEPEWEEKASPERLQKYYTFLKAESPAIPVAICFSTKSVRTESLKHIWSDFLNQTDIVAFDTYPVYGQGFPNARLSDVTDFTQETLASKKPIMPAIQMFNWKTISGVVEKAKTGTYHIKEAGNNPEIWRYPNIQEMRYWGFSSLIQNVQGLMWWSYARSVTVEHADPSWIDEVLTKVTKEISDFTKLINAEGYSHKAVQLSNNSLLSAIWENDRSSVLVIANQTDNVQVISDNMVFKYLEGGEELLSESNDIAIDETNQQVQLAPWGVVILKSL